MPLKNFRIDVELWLNFMISEAGIMCVGVPQAFKNMEIIGQSLESKLRFSSWLVVMVGDIGVTKTAIDHLLEK